MFEGKRLKNLEKKVEKLQMAVNVKVIPKKGMWCDYDGYIRVDVNKVVEDLLVKLGYELRIKGENISSNFDIVEKIKKGVK